MNKSHIVYNAIKTPDGTIVESISRHDFVEYKDKNGKTYAVDGGLEYLRRSAEDNDYEELSMTTEAPFEKIREVVKWGHYGKSGREPLQFVILKDMTTDHIESILKTQKLQDWRKELFEKELELRTVVQEELS